MNTWRAQCQKASTLRPFSWLEKRPGSRCDRRFPDPKPDQETVYLGVLCQTHAFGTLKCNNVDLIHQTQALRMKRFCTPNGGGDTMIHYGCGMGQWTLDSIFSHSLGTKGIRRFRGLQFFGSLSCGASQCIPDALAMFQARLVAPSCGFCSQAWQISDYAHHEFREKPIPPLEPTLH